MKNYKYFLKVALGLNLILIFGLMVYGYKENLPSDIKLIKGSSSEFYFDIPAVAMIYSKQDTDMRKVIDCNKSFSLKSNETGNYDMQVKLFGILPIETIPVSVIDQMYAVPAGTTIGIYVNTEGVLVIDTGEVTTVAGGKVEPCANTLQSGDYITKINGEKVVSKRKLMKRIQDCGGEGILFTVNRHGNEIEVKVIPAKTGMDEYKVGIWVRDDLQGLGTLTYVTGKEFGALGHSINDIDTGKMVTVSGGEIYNASILGIEKGSTGSPGEIEGIIEYAEEYFLGEIKRNKEFGIYGTIEDINKLGLNNNKAIPIALKQEVKTGKAYVRSAVSGAQKDYEIEIVKVDYSNSNTAKAMEIKITDPELIYLTGGIIQGMSGSPIIQNEKLIGAVTHVFVQDPTGGYGAFVESMIHASRE